MGNNSPLGFSTTTLSCMLMVVALFSQGCALVPQHSRYRGPVERPQAIVDYYNPGSSFSDYSDELLLSTDDYKVHRIYLESEFGQIVLDYFQRTNPGDEVIFVFPILGGRNHFENYIAHYFATGGFDAVVIHRDGEFKRPENFNRLEELFRNNVVKDRIVMDFFEQEFSKKRFGSFGISRGAINAATTAGVDPRLKYNVFVLGGADLVDVFRDSNEPGIQRYQRRVLAHTGITQEQFFAHLEKEIVTDPKNVARYIDARDTLMFLSIFDQAVPIKYGLRLRRDIGLPETVFLVSGHYSTLLYTQFVKVFPPVDPVCVFPFDYVETESLAFFRNKFGHSKFSMRHMIYEVISLPAQLVARIANAIW